jgi:anti-sigma B factor antagonist
MTDDTLVEITFHVTAGRPVVALRGEIDLSNAEKLEQALHSVGTVPSVAVDMTELRFMDSTGLNALVRYGQTVTSAGGVMYLVVVNATLRKIFSVTNLDQHFPIVSSLAELPSR